MNVVLSLLLFSSMILSSLGATTTGDEALPAYGAPVLRVIRVRTPPVVTVTQHRRRIIIVRRLLRPAIVYTSSTKHHQAFRSTTAKPTLPDIKCTRTCRPSKPICGSDGNTYPSECHLKKRNCVKKDLVKQCNGPCKKVKGRSCCSIKRRCPMSFRTPGPVCGTNDVTYPNLCLLAIAICKEKGLKIKGEKKCSDIVPTEIPAKPTEGEYCVDEQWGKQCPGKCKTVNDVHCCDIRTRCPQVFKTSGPVCGTNGVSYVNQCVLAKTTCRTAGLLIQKDYDGMCREKVVTTSVLRVATTEERTNENSVTDSQNCSDAALGKKCKGQCKFVHGVDCCNIIEACPLSFNESGPVCGNDNVTYSNLCTLSQRACQIFDSQLRYSYMGVCKVRGGDNEMDSERITQPTSFTTKVKTTASPVQSRTTAGKMSIGYTSRIVKDLYEYRTKPMRTVIPSENLELVPEYSGILSGADMYIVVAELFKNHRPIIQPQETTNRIITTPPETVPTSATVAETYIPSTPAINQVTSPTLSTQLSINEDMHSNSTDTFIEATPRTPVGHKGTSIATDMPHCQDNILGKDCKAECKFVSGVHCCDIIDYGCPKSFTLSGPVCGSDGSSYSNLCVLARRSCQTSGSILVKVSYGTCDKTSPIIEDESKPNTDFFCVDIKHGKSCDGECKVVNNHHCCDIRNRCPNKLKKTGSVCGTDGRTYGSQCALVRKSCREHGSVLQMAHKGSCKKTNPPRLTRPSKLIPSFEGRGNDLPGDGDITMPPFLITDILIQRDLVKEDPCRADCPSWNSPVCGNNMVTYKNACELKKARCRKPSIRQFCDARCRLDDGRNCCMMIKKCHKSLKNTGVVCGSDGKNYASECHLFREACRTVEFKLYKDSDGPCPPDQIQSVEMKFSMIECLATFHCPIEMALAGEVCSDIGTTYQDKCALMVDSCWGENRNIGLDYMGRCKP